MDKILVDGEILYIEGLKSLDGDQFEYNGIRDAFSIDNLKTALKPVAQVGKVIKEGMLDLAPDEVEMTIQLQLAVSGDKLAFSLIKAEAEAHLTVKYVWKK